MRMGKLHATFLVLVLALPGCGQEEAGESDTKAQSNLELNPTCPADAAEAEALGVELLQLTLSESLKGAVERSADLKRLLTCGWRSEVVEDDGTKVQTWLFNWGEGRTDSLVVRDGLIDSVNSESAEAP